MCELTDKQIDRIADKVTEKLKAGRSRGFLSSEDTEAIMALIHTKKSAVRLFLWVFAAVSFWALKDIYIYLIDHIKFLWGT